MSAKVKGLLGAYAVFLGMVIVTNLVTRPVVRRVSTAANVPALGNLI
jgi:hypothetical protein